jgi:hypothetical protein
MHACSKRLRRAQAHLQDVRKRRVRRLAGGELLDHARADIALLLREPRRDTHEGA